MIAVHPVEETDLPLGWDAWAGGTHGVNAVDNRFALSAGRTTVGVGCQAHCRQKLPQTTAIRAGL